MPTYHVALTIEPRTDVDDEALIISFTTPRSVRCAFAIEMKPTGLVIEAEALSLQILEASLRDLLGRRGCRLDSIAATRI